MDLQEALTLVATAPRLDTQIVFANDFDRDAFTCYNANPTLTTDGTQCLLADIRDVKDQIQMYVLSLIHI